MEQGSQVLIISSKVGGGEVFPLSVCASVWLSVSRIYQNATDKFWWILLKGATCDRQLDFGDDSDHDVIGGFLEIDRCGIVKSLQICW